MGKVKIFSGKAKAAACAACAGFHRAHTCGKVPLKQKPAVKASSGCAACRGSHRAHTVRHSVGAARAGEGRDLLGCIRSSSQFRFSLVAFYGRADRSPGGAFRFGASVRGQGRAAAGAARLPRLRGQAIDEGGAVIFVPPRLFCMDRCMKLISPPVARRAQGPHLQEGQPPLRRRPLLRPLMTRGCVPCPQRCHTPCGLLVVAPSAAIAR
jgi:hypothetical protein